MTAMDIFTIAYAGRSRFAGVAGSHGYPNHGI